MTEPKTDTLEAPGAVLHYDVRSVGSTTDPVLLIIGSPMGAAGFVTLAGHFPDRTVVTYDPRGSGRSQRTDGALETTPDEHADDLHRLISALDAGPVDIFATSGGAVNALALVARHPEQVRMLVAHEPPSFAELPDSGPVLAGHSAKEAGSCATSVRTCSGCLAARASALTPPPLVAKRSTGPAFSAEISRCRSSACSSGVVSSAPSVRWLRPDPRGS